MKTMHRGAILEKISHALPSRSDPETVPDISGMEGVPAQDLQWFKAKIRSTALSAQSPTAKQPRPQVKPEVKKQKIDTPLDAQTIQAQLAEFQQKKHKEELQDLINSGVLLPPGLTPEQSLEYFQYRTHPPPGTGPYAAKPIATQLKDGKSDLSASSSSYIPIANPTNPAPSSSSSNVASKSVFSVSKN